MNNLSRQEAIVMSDLDEYKFGYQKSQLKKENTASASSMQQTVLMFRDLQGTLMSQVERLLFSLGVLPEEEFEFHGYSPNRLVELQPEFIAYKLSLSFKNLASFHTNMEDDFEAQNDDLADLMKKHIPSAFAIYAARFQDKLKEQTLAPDQVHTQKLLNSVLDRIVKGQFAPLDSELASKIKSQIQRAPAPANRVQTDQTGLLKQVELMQKHEKQTEEYLRVNQNQIPPSSAFQPATRENALVTKDRSTYIDTRPVTQKPFNKGVKEEPLIPDSGKSLEHCSGKNKFKAFLRGFGSCCFRYCFNKEKEENQ